jgi:predicted  nucleic acid-binding Zn ribbon protein
MATGAFEGFRPAAEDTLKAERAALNADVDPDWMYNGDVLGQYFQLGCLLLNEG